MRHTHKTEHGAARAAPHWGRVWRKMGGVGGDGAREGRERPGPSPAARLTRCRAKCPPSCPNPPPCPLRPVLGHITHTRQGWLAWRQPDEHKHEFRLLAKLGTRRGEKQFLQEFNDFKNKHKYVENWNPHALLVETQNGAVAEKTVW